MVWGCVFLPPASSSGRHGPRGRAVPVSHRPRSRSRSLAARLLRNCRQAPARLPTPASAAAPGPPAAPRPPGLCSSALLPPALRVGGFFFFFFFAAKRWLSNPWDNFPGCQRLQSMREPSCASSQINPTRIRPRSQPRQIPREPGSGCAVARSLLAGAGKTLPP